jgi:dihydrofolate synthase/folylpolyglutamate synthase
VSERPSPFERLASLRGQSVELGLWQITRLLDRLDHPERDYPAVHVAGTNGKGSVCAMVAASLARAGHRVGLLTSPHLVDYAERIRVDGRPIPTEDADEILSRLEREDGTFDGSFFEVTTALAFEHFRRRGVDVAVLEVGLGGRLDATNVCHPRVSVVTSIDLDHTKTLGPDRASIAAEKAGIVKPGVPVVLGPMAEEARATLELIAARRGAPLHVAHEEAEIRVLDSSWEGLDVTIRLPGDRHRGTRVPLAGRHQADNLLLAAVAARLFDPREEALEALLAGMEDTAWAGRLSRVEGNPVRVYDVAHNLAGAEALGRALDELGVPPGSVLVVGLLGDKDLSGMARGLSRHFRTAVAATPPHPLRARPAAETAEAFRAAGLETLAVEDVGEAVEAAKRRLAPGGWILVTGSLFTVGAAMRALGDPVDAPGRSRPANFAARRG